jgi:hypothetical protein
LSIDRADALRAERGGAASGAEGLRGRVRLDHFERNFARRWGDRFGGKMLILARGVPAFPRLLQALVVLKFLLGFSNTC